VTAPRPLASVGAPSRRVVPALEAFEALAAARRSSLRVQRDTPVPRELVDRLCRLAACAPNHHRTRPWRFVAFSGAGRARLGAALEAGQRAAGVTDTAKLDKARTKYLRAPVVLVVLCTGDPDSVVDAENRDAVAAAIQTLLLGARAAGLTSLWSTGAAARDEHVLDLCGGRAGDRIVGLVYLGWPLDEDAPPERCAPGVVHVTA
jgi:nitroreductase